MQYDMPISDSLMETCRDSSLMRFLGYHAEFVTLFGPDHQAEEKNS